jgi:hypothetical protein
MITLAIKLKAEGLKVQSGRRRLDSECGCENKLVEQG